MQSGGLELGPAIDFIHTRATIAATAEAGAGDFGVIVEGRKRDSDRPGVGIDLAKNTPSGPARCGCTCCRGWCSNLATGAIDSAFAFGAAA